VVRLHQRVQQLRDRDGLVRLEALREVVALEDPRHGDRLGEADDLRVRQLPEPLTVEPDLRAPAVEHAEGLLGELLRVRVENLARKDRPLVRTPRRVADARGVVPDDQNDRVAGALKLRQSVEDERKPEVDVRRGRIDAELDAQWTSELQLALELA